MQQFPSDVDKTVISGPISEATQVVSQPNVAVTQMAMTVECPVCRTPNASTETYCSDCGFLLGSTPVEVDMPEMREPSAKLTATDGREFALKTGVNTVGRVDTDVLVPDPTVSRKHAEISFTDGEWWITDAGSTNGTFIDNTQLQANQPKQLVSGAAIKFGAVAMTFSAEEVVTAEAAPVAEAPVAEATVALNVEPAVEQPLEDVSEEAAPSDVAEDTQVETAEAEAEPAEAEVVEPEVPALVGKLVNMTDPSANYPLVSGVNTIGRAPGNNIQVLGDPYVSSRHAQITFEEDKFSLTDVGSTNGTLLNGQAVPKQEPQELKEGDEIGIGQGRYRLEA
jgi:pSer/pThr/pTyr-binding forkhead associated (FHA) protein